MVTRIARPLIFRSSELVNVRAKAGPNIQLRKLKKKQKLGWQVRCNRVAIKSSRLILTSRGQPLSWCIPLSCSIMVHSIPSLPLIYSQNWVLKSSCFLVLVSCDFMELFYPFIDSFVWGSIYLFINLVNG